ncbi:hypothetical protein ACFQRH_02050 [Emcibacter nanhaiensis]
MSRKELPIRFKAYPHANDNGSVSGSPLDPRLLSLARLIARAAVRDLIDGQTANDNLTVAGRHPVKGTEHGAAAPLIVEQTESDPRPPHTAEPLSTTEPSRYADLPAGRQLDLFPDAPNSENTHDH